MNSSPALFRKKCVSCEKGTPRLSPGKCKKLLLLLGEDWKLSKKKNSLYAEFRMADFNAAVQFLNRIAKIAEKEDHHPDFHLTGYRNFRIDLQTHAIQGLSENDFILASKIDCLSKKRILKKAS